MQLAKELAETPDLTASSDGTGHKHIEYVSRAVSYKVDGNQKMRTLGIHSASDKSAQTQFNGLKGLLDEFAEVWNSSPSAKTSKLFFYKESYAEKLRGTSGDHAKDVKKQHFDLLQTWKDSVRDSKLGWQKIVQLPAEELTVMLGMLKEKVIDERGGVGVYMHMSMDQVRAMDMEILQALVVELGGKEYNALPESEQRKLSLFVWGGCCMHKDLNTIKGGDKTMQAYWDTNGRIPPVTLANKVNAAILAEAHDDSEKVGQGGAHGQGFERNWSRGSKATPRGLEGYNFASKWS
ncbi:hypothetical protein MIND_00650200 [Mycena indigotica]|uniref:Uncharacterized protein n=1 Tax=Mycena indigotica TaxID=2126181 RepID=A0A8H6ST20_9AGAR|nr:uncharacterized protein MIND_00650200 [Mycena indigotica]KAF7304181.1 hypothetical protein MIND_00650200 [Mycena indigotica]